MAAKKYTREALLADKRFSQYQKDFLGVILSKPYYTLAEATKVVEAFFERRVIDYGRRNLELPEQSPARRIYPL